MKEMCPKCGKTAVQGAINSRLLPELPFEAKLPGYICPSCKFKILQPKSIGLISSLKRDLLNEHFGSHCLKALSNKNHFKHMEKSSSSLLGEAPKGVYQDTKTKERYLFKWPKVRAKDFTHGFRETVSELIMSRLAQRLTSSAECSIGLYRKEIVFVSKIFITFPQRLVHGVEIFKNLYDDKGIDEIQKKREAQRSFYTVQHIESALDEYCGSLHSGPIVNSFHRMILVDAWLGNQDRHAENWGVISTVPSIGSEAEHQKFAPLFDTARGIFWNTDLVQLVSLYLNNKRALMRYIDESEPLEPGPKI